MTKAAQTKIIQELEVRNQKLLTTLVQIQSSASWDGKAIRVRVQNVLSDIIGNPPAEVEKIKRSRKKRELQTA